MRFKGTKGKWEYKEEKHGQFIVCGNYCVASVNDHAGNKTTEANAKLISYAPEMLEMLDKVLDHIRVETPRQVEFFSSVEKLIKKASE